MKICCECKKNLSLEFYSKDKNKKDGLNNRCKECCSIRNKKRYQEKKEIIKQQTSKYYYDNKDILLEKQKIISKKFREHNPNWSKEYKEKNKEKIKKYLKEYQEKNQKPKYHSNSKFRYNKITSNNIRSFLKGKKNEKTEDLLKYTYEDFKEKIGEIPIGYHIDHKIPISWFKEDTPINIIWNLENLQITTSQYNLKKSNTHSDKVSEFYLKIAINHLKDEYKNNSFL